MKRKFKVELDIEVDDKTKYLTRDEVLQYIENELGWINESFDSTKIVSIKEIK